MSNGEEDNGAIPERQMLVKEKKKLLVLSLGGLLCHRACRKRPSSLLRNRIPDASYGSIVGLTVKISSTSAWKDFKWLFGLLPETLDCVMGPLRRKLLFSWDQSQCTKSEFNTLENKDKPIFFKELSKIWAIYPHFSASNTLLIDDKPYKAILNPPNTALFLNEYDGGNREDKGLAEGSQLRQYLEGLAKAENGVDYVKNYLFGNAAITPSHPDWAYYSRILNAHSHFTAS